ncbi:KGG domain-containing protein [Polluticoccus soli]|uniref:KGG domain-containing protein n=1 Tax=Polluticoccus soli TaxID=3034150 RepID=UPI0023E0972C|nr:KGG domain-containing protein [Flavipsychrobacter sp. JY13-12]
MQISLESDNGNNARKTSKRGFASMDLEKRREIASKGGRAVSSNNEHMVEIGRRGGAASGETRRRKANQA